MSWFSRTFGKNTEESPPTLNVNPDLIREANELSTQQELQTTLVRMQGRELRQQMIASALDIRLRREQS